MKRGFLILASLLISVSSFATKRTFYGKASWYGGKFHGRTTASGEIYDMNKLTAAHKKLPFGTILKVTNLGNGKTIQVKVNDRGPFVRGRILDVSKKAAADLGFTKKGVTNIKAEIMFLPGEKKRDFDFQDEVIDQKNPDEKQKKTAKSNSKEDKAKKGESIEQIIESLKSELGEDGAKKKCDKTQKKETVKNKTGKKNPELLEKSNMGEKKISSGGNVLKENFEQKTFQIFVIQLGAFTSKKRAERFQKAIKKKKIDSYITKVGRSNLTLYKVREKNVYKKINSVMQRVKELKKMGIECFAVGKFFLGS